MAKTEIEWADHVWNPVTGCTQVSPGCDHCYALTFAERWRGTPGHYFEHGFDVQLRPNKLDEPLHWRKHRRIFVNSMSDLFHADIPDDYIGRVFDTMRKADWHTYLILTKRPGRMRSWIHRFASEPLPNVWLGVSAEDQHWADIRIPILTDTPAAIRWVSAEPLLGPIDLSAYLPTLDWIVAGGESGIGHRPMNPAWVRALRDQCVTTGTPFLFKQWGGRTHSAGGRVLDGRTWDQYPASEMALF